MSQNVENDLSSVPTGQAVGNESVNLGLWERLVGIVDRPTAVLAEIYSRPRWAWLIPILLLIASVVIVNVVSAPYAAQAAREEIRRQMQALPEAQAAQMAQQAESLSSPLFVGATGAIMGALGIVAGILLAAGILYFSALIAGAEVDFAPLFGIVVWMWLPFFLRNLVEAGYIYINGGLIVNQGLSWLVSVGDPMKDAGNIAYFLLSYAQVFVFWHLVLVWVGLRGVLKLPGGTSFVLVVIYALVSVILRWIPIQISLALSGTI